MEKNHIEQIKHLTRALMLSGAFNIILLSLFFYWIIKESPPTAYCELKPIEKKNLAMIPLDKSNIDVINSFKTLNRDQLIAKLSSTQLFENGYSQRDLALGYLISIHHFDLMRSLHGKTLPEAPRTITFSTTPDGKRQEILVYPGLSENHYQAIIQFANTEKWPLTSQGIFLALKEHLDDKDPSLVDAFILTPEFLAVDMLFNRLEPSVDKKELLTVLKDGDWQRLVNLVENQRSLQDLSPSRRQSFLLEYIQLESKAAANLLLKTDYAFALKKLDDDNILKILNLLPEKTPEAQQFAKDLLKSPRRDAVRQMAANRFDGQTTLPIESETQQRDTSSHLIPQQTLTLIKQETKKLDVKKNVKQHLPAVTKPTSQTLVKATSSSKIPIKLPKVRSLTSDKLYIIQEGDSLWKISRRFNVDVETIRKYNHLQSDFLKPGTPIRLP